MPRIVYCLSALVSSGLSFLCFWLISRGGGSGVSEWKGQIGHKGIGLTRRETRYRSVDHISEVPHLAINSSFFLS